MSLDGRLKRLEQDLQERQIQAHVDRLAAELGLSPDEIWQEAKDVIEYYDLYGRYPADVQWALDFVDAHGRLPTLEEWTRWDS